MLVDGVLTDGNSEKKGLRGPLNWYRTGRVNYEEELEVAKEGPARWRVGMPAMIVTAKRDPFLPPAMSASMGKLCDDLTRHEVNTGHWAIWEAPEEVNGYIGEFMEKVLAGEEKGGTIKASI